MDEVGYKMCYNLEKGGEIMETTIMDVLDSAKGSADEITHILYLYGGGNMGKGIEKVVEQTFDMGQKYAFRQVRSGIAKIGVPIFAIGCLGFQTIKYIKVKQKISKVTDGETERDCWDICC